MSEMERELGRRIEGEVRFDRYSRILYSTDASIYQIEPLGVVLPKHRGDVEELVRCAARERAPVLPRGGGTSLAGQAVGEAVVIDFSKYMNRVLELNREEGWVRVEPGVVQESLGAFLRPHGLRFGPETATSNRANLGGMIGNNSAGARSLVYGKTVDNLLEVRAILSDGSEATFGPVPRAEIAAKTEGEGLEAAIYRAACRIAESHREEVLLRYPRIPRRVSGYNLDELYDPRHLNLARILVGSEGTLATVVEAKLALAPLPRATGLAVLHFDDLLPALEAGCEALRLAPSAVELVDRMVLDLARKSLEYSRRLHFVQGEPGALIVVEFQGESDSEVRSRIESLDSLVGRGASAVTRVLDPVDQANVWKVRKAALPLLLGLPGDHKPIAFVEDTAVSPDRLPEYIRRFQAILDEHRTVGSFYAHAGAGCLHIRPLINLKEGAEVEKMRRLAEEVCDLVLEFGGAMSGEHGDGLARSHFNRKIFGEKLYGAFRELKAAFDPQGIMNPGKVVEAPDMTSHLRYGDSYRARELPTAFPYPREGGFARAVELCNGSGVCRKSLEGTMCPSYMVTLEEEHSTRGRANALRAVLDGRLPPEEIGAERLRQVMDLCISCKGCKAECPSNVDMARLKADYLALYHREHPFSLRDRIFTRVDLAGRLGVLTAPFSNWMLRQSWFRSVLAKVAGIDPRRSLPPFARQSFETWFSRAALPREGQRGQVLLFHDTFTNYHEPEVGIAAARLLSRAGFGVVLARRTCCGRPMISRGMLERARELARANLEALHPFVARGAAIVGLEPSCLLGLRDEYPDLVPGERADEVAAASFLLEEFLERNRVELEFPSRPEKILVHGHCHQKALSGAEPLLAVLRRTGARVDLVDSGCCGMAGSFGYEEEHFDISVRMAERRLLPAVRAASNEVVLVAPGTSCRHQILDGTGRKAHHPAEVLARAAGLT